LTIGNLFFFSSLYRIFLVWNPEYASAFTISRIYAGIYGPKGKFSSTDFSETRGTRPHLLFLRLFTLTRRNWLGAVLFGIPRRGLERYRVDATIVLFGVPVFKRTGVGSAWAQLEEGGGERRLRFAAGSWPRKAHGLNRLGFVEERVNSAGSSYFGFMTASAEESFADAQRALASEGGEEAKYTAIAGEVRPGRAECRTARFTFPARYDWGLWDELYPMASEAFSRQAGRSAVQAAEPRAAAHSFLHTLIAHAEAGIGRHSHAFVYGTSEMELRSTVRRDGALLRLDGKVASGNRTLSQFRLWYREGWPLPVRVDLAVKAFLRLTLERS
jgi:hypothetical protein